MSLWIIALLFVAMLLIGVPLFISLGIATALCFSRISPLPDPGLLAQQMFMITDKGELLAIPFFVLAAVIMTRGSSARRIVDFIGAAVKWLPGGMAIATIFSCVFFAAMCGLTPTAIVAVGSILFPGLIAAGYPRRFSLGLVTSASSLGTLVPPSLVVLVFVVVATSSIQNYNQAAQEAALIKSQEHTARNPQSGGASGGDFMPAWAEDVHKKLNDKEGRDAEKKKAVSAPPRKATQLNLKTMFIAGVVPVVLAASIFCLFGVFTALRSGAKRERFSGAVFRKAFISGFPALVLPALVIFTILTGKLTATQAAAMAAAYALFIEVFVFRSVKLRDLTFVARETGSIVGMILIILAVTIAFNYFLTNELLIVDLTEYIKAHFHSRIAFLLAVNVLFLFLGSLMDILSAVFVTVPLLLPAAMALGIDPVHFGIMFIMNFEIGYLTPPVAVNLFTSAAVFKKDMAEITRAVLPFLGLLLLVLALVTYFPVICLWLVRLVGG